VLYGGLSAFTDM